MTSDNTRTEDPEKIIEDVVVGVEKVKKNKPDLYYEVIADRRQAIKRAVSPVSYTHLFLTCAATQIANGLSDVMRCLRPERFLFS